MNFNEAQKQIINHREGACLVTASAGGGKCISGESLVLTNKGIIKIEDIPKYFDLNVHTNEISNAYVSTYNSSNGERIIKQPSHWYNMGQSKTKRITSNMGFSVEGTYEHPLLTINSDGNLEFKKCSDIQLGDYICLSKGDNLFGDNTQISLGLSYCIGVLLGDGLIRHRYIKLTNADMEIINLYTLLMSKEFNIEKDKIKVHPYKDENCYNVDIYSVYITSRLKECGMSLTSVASTKKIPQSIMTAPRDVVIQCLKGLFDTDGSCGNRGIEYVTKSKEMGRQVHILLANLGIISKKYTKIVNGEGYERILISGSMARVFKEVIGFNCIHKQKALEKLCSKRINDNINIIPYQANRFKRIRKDLFTKSNYNGGKQILLLKDGSHIRMKDYLYGTRNVTPLQTKRIISAITSSNEDSVFLNNVSDNIFFDKVTDIKDNESIVYDFTVPITHSFVANGIVNHNTFSLVNRTKAMINDGISPKDITIVTFTKNSAKDLVERLSEVGVTDVRVGTFHSICARILGATDTINMGSSFSIRNYEVDNLWVKLNGGQKTECEEIRSFISYQKAYNVRENDEFVMKKTNYDTTFLRECYKAYEDYKRRKGAIDFDDILLYAYDLFKAHEGDNTLDEFRTSYLMVDEHQDSNLIQNKLIPYLCSTQNIMCIGDVRQTLYSFRGSSPQQFLNFTSVYPNAKVIDMNINYRSCYNIIERVNKFAHNWYVGDLFTDTVPFIQEKGKIVRKRVYSEEEESDYVVDQIQELLDNKVNPKDIVVLYRYNASSSMIEMKLKERGVKYEIDSENSFFKIKEIRAVLCMLRLIVSEEDNMAYEELFNTRMGGFKFLPNTIMDSIRSYAMLSDVNYLKASEYASTPKPFQKQRLLDISRSIVKLRGMLNSGLSLIRIVEAIINELQIEDSIKENQLYDSEKKQNRLNCLKSLKMFTRTTNIHSFLDLAYSTPKAKKEKEVKNISLMTVHKSKGLEWDNVFFIGNNENFPNREDPISVSEDANVFYVGTTRAKRNLWVTETGEGSIFVEQFCQR